LLAEQNRENYRDFLKIIGSNLKLAKKSLSVEFKNPWNIIAPGQTTSKIKLAEGEGVEPPVTQAPRRFSKPQL
jgi:hypothetical protein